MPKNKSKKAKHQMKCLDLETMTIHNVVSICYHEKRVVMQNDEYGHTSNKFKKVKLLIDL